ncbi:MAG: tetratricopeptide repeat protein [Clostridiales Family XIII bacterium]|nr:tetratricopeptide repeat protein [Clostridiales Family XIII bacterium]
MKGKPEAFYAELDRLFASGDSQAAESFLLAHGKLAAETDEQLYIMCMSELGGLYRGSGKYGESVEAFEKAGGAIERMYGAHSANYATNLNNLAGTLRSMGENARSLDLFETAIKIMEETIGRDNYHYASALNNVSLLYQSERKFDDAMKALTQSMEILEKLPDTEIEFATAYSNMSLIYQQTGKWDKAREAVGKSLGIFARFPPNPHGAAALNAQANVSIHEGNLEGARGCLEAAIALTRKFCAQSPEIDAMTQALNDCRRGNGGEYEGD